LSQVIIEQDPSRQVLKATQPSVEWIPLHFERGKTAVARN